jgi:uncharacterized protein
MGESTVRVSEVEVEALDGVVLRGTLVRPAVGTADRAVLLVHGGGVTREEGGFFGRLAGGLAEAGVASLRIDLRGHGTSGGRQEDLTASVIMNDLRVSLGHLQRSIGAVTSLLGTSFTGGLCATYAARRPEDVERLVLLNPQLDYRARTVSPPWWEADRLIPQAARQLDEQGWIQFRPSLRHGRAILHEAFWFEVELERITAPTLLVHGTQDTFVPIEATRSNAPRLRVPYRLHEVDGAQHGFAVHDDPTYAHPQSQTWQAEVIALVTTWILNGPDEPAKEPDRTDQERD